MFATFLGTCVFLALMAGIFVPLESWQPRTAGSMTRRAVVTGVALLLVDVLLMEAVGGAVLDTLAGWRPRFEAPSGLRLLGVFVGAELAGYWAHRTMHRVPWLWRLHHVHHAPARVHWLDAWRQHPIDFLIHGIVVGLPGVLLGASLSELGSVVLLRKTYTTFLHANVHWPLRALTRWIATPAWHNLHHSHDPRHYDRNFAGTFPVIDRLFGTHADVPTVR